MRILFSSPPAVGHIHPMLPLARVLQSRGHEVRWATGSDNTDRLVRAGFPAHESGLPNRELRATFAARYPEAQTVPGHEHRRHVLPKMFGAIATPPMLANMLELVARWRPDLFVHDAADFAAAIVAGKLDVPHVTHGFGAVIPTDLLRLAGTELAPLWSGEGLTPDPLAGSYQHLYLAIYPPSMQLPDIADAPQVQLLWPGPADVVASPGAGTTAIERGRRPFVYATFGTVQNRVPAFAAAVSGLAGLDADILVTVGADGDTAQFGLQPANVRVERYVPQAEILSLCDLVVSHAGSGTLLAGLERGIPQLCLPQAADQFVNASAATAAGAGLGLMPAEVEPAAIAHAASRLLQDPAFRSAAGRVAAEIAGMPPAAAVAPVLERLAQV